MVKTGFMEFIGHKVDMTSSDTYIEESFGTPVGKSENLAMLIHKVRLELATGIVALGHADRYSLQLTKNTKDSVINYDDPDLICKWDLYVSSAAAGNQAIDRIKEIDFDPPILYSKSKLWFAVDSASTSQSNQGVVQVGYTLEKVKPDEFIAALTD